MSLPPPPQRDVGPGGGSMDAFCSLEIELLDETGGPTVGSIVK
jgi:hypothetical protein